MKRAIALVIPLILAATTAYAAQSSGNAALALAATIGWHSPDLSNSDRSAMAAVLDDFSKPLPTPARPIVIKADKIRCRMGDVDIAMHECVLTFGTKTVTLSGAVGQNFLATMIENGVQADGAAGTIYYTVAPIRCTVDVAQVKAHDGGGAKCIFTNGE